jgi:hypothetical protein
MPQLPVAVWPIAVPGAFQASFTDDPFGETRT